MADVKAGTGEKLVAGVLALGTIVVLGPALLSNSSSPALPAARPPAAINPTEPTVLHAVEGFDGTPSPHLQHGVQPASLERTVSDSEEPAATTSALELLDETRR